MSSFALKIIGIGAMLCDHIGRVFFGDLIELQLVGRLAFPIFAFGVAQGYLHTRDFKRYVERLAIFAVLSQVPYTVFSMISGGDLTTLNVIFTLLLGLVAIYVCDKLRNMWLSVAIVLLLCGVAELLGVDYGAYGVGLILLFYYYTKGMEVAKNNLRRRFAWSILTLVSFVVMTVFGYLDAWVFEPGPGEFWASTVIWTVASFGLIILYNEKMGIKCKYLFYVFYPIHLLAISLISIVSM